MCGFSRWYTGLLDIWPRPLEQKMKFVLKFLNYVVSAEDNGHQIAMFGSFIMLTHTFGERKQSSILSKEPITYGTHAATLIGQKCTSFLL